MFLLIDLFQNLHDIPCPLKVPDDDSMNHQSLINIRVDNPCPDLIRCFIREHLSFCLHRLLHFFDCVFIFPIQMHRRRMLSRGDRPAAGREDAASDAASGEQQRNILEFQILGLRIEEVHHRNESRVQHGEDDERTPLDAGCSRPSAPACT